MWHVRILAEDHEVGSLRAARCLYYGADNLAERLADEGEFLSVVAEQLLNPDGGVARALEDAVEQPGNLLVLDSLNLSAPLDDDLVITTLVADVIDRLTDNGFAVVLPRGSAEGAGGELLDRAGAALAAQPFSDELQIIDTCLAAPEKAAGRARARLHASARHGDLDLLDEEGGWEDDEARSTWSSSSSRTAVGVIA